MDKVQHFEIPYDDQERAQKFYNETFGWRIQDMPEMNYTLVYTVEVDDKMMAKEPNAVNGGMLKRQTQAPNPVIVITVKNMDEALVKVKGNGGQLVSGPVQVGEMGHYSRIKDTEGNIMGLWQEAKRS